ncbi:MAG: hypothetical protein NW216_07575 [Hyphomicrobium sp.]|nr:hypothetical protein [Hyphomicrobium sp.]
MLHAAMRLPALTSLFSDALATTSMALTPGGDVVLSLAAPIGLANGTSVAIAIADGPIAPNAVTAATVLANGDIRLTLAFDHDLSMAPDGADYPAFDTFVSLTGFASALVNGSRQLRDVPARNQLVIVPGGPVASVTLSGSEKLLERLPPGVPGWHAATVTGASSLAFPAPPGVTRAMTVASPAVVRNIRAWGSIDWKWAQRKFTADDGKMTVGACHLFVTPVGEVRTSRSKSSKTDALAEVHAGVDLRQVLIDGFNVYVFVPATSYSGQVGASDLCHGPLFTAVMRTFNGLNLRRPELAAGDSYVSLLASHGAVAFDGAVYVHGYEFQSLAAYTQSDAVAPWEAADTTGVVAGSPITDLVPVGTGVWRDIDFTGILHDGFPQPLSGSFYLEHPPT